MERVVDPITFSVLLHRFKAIAREMTLTLEYTAWTSILAWPRILVRHLRSSGTAGLHGRRAADSHQLAASGAQGDGSCVADDIAEGDVIVCNDPYSGNTHVGDVVTACPVFYKGRHLFWSVTKGHQLDIGSIFPPAFPPPLKMYGRKD